MISDPRAKGAWPHESTIDAPEPRLGAKGFVEGNALEPIRSVETVAVLPRRLSGIGSNDSDRLLK